MRQRAILVRRGTRGGARGLKSDDLIAAFRADFECFDRLPKTLRRALANAENKYDSVQLYRLWKNKEMTCAQLVRQLRAFEQSQKEIDGWLMPTKPTSRRLRD